MEQQPSAARIALKWGILTAIVIMVYSTILYMTDLWKNSWAMNTTFILLATGIFMGIKEYRTQNSNFLSIGNGLAVGSLLSTIVGLISSTYGYVYYGFIDNTMLQKSIDFQRQKLEEEGLPDEQIDQAMEMMASFMSPGLIFIIGVVMYLIIGFIFSLIISAIHKNNKPEI